MADGDGWWGTLSASAKRAVRWAHAYALLRGEGEVLGDDPTAVAEIDSLDLLAGLLIVHGDDSEPWDFFRHFDIPIGPILRGRRAEATALNASLQRSEREHPVPPLFGEARAVIDHGIERLAPSDPEGLLSFTLLFAALLETTNAVSTAIRSALESRGAPAGDIIVSFHDYATGSHVAAH